IAWPQVFGTAGNVQNIADQFGVRGVPTAFIIGSDGKIAATDLPAAQIAKRLEQVLSGSDAAQP
ncbi:MAG: hypothetical protein KJ749_00555, partial [Planctomycetes bacterium]|nr:hypothetical protein [Planctomycetota bacterium]